MTTQRKRFMLIIAAVLVLVAIIIFVLWWLLRSPEAPDVVDETPVEDVLPSQPVRDNTTSEPEIYIPPVSEASASVVSRNFTERFGTYSTDSPFVNVFEVADITTDVYQSELAAVIRPLEDQEYQGVTTRVLTITQTSGSDEEGQMLFTVKVQQEASGADRSDAQITYRTGQVSVGKYGESWLVNDFSWQE